MTEQTQNQEQSLKKVSLELKGFVLTTRVPSEEYLQDTIDESGLGGEAYMSLVRDLEDLLAGIDKIYAKRTTRGRSLQGHHCRVEREKISRTTVLKFSPFPSHFSNNLKTIRFDMYRTIKNICLTLKILEEGRFRRNIYLLPESETQSLFTAVSALNVRVRRVNADITKYMEAPHKTDIANRIDLTLIGGQKYKVTARVIPDVTVDLTPVNFSQKTIDEWENRDPQVAQALNNKRRELVEKAVVAVQEKINNAVAAINTALSLKSKEHIIDEARDKLVYLRKFCDDIGLQALADAVVDPLLVKINDTEAIRLNIDTNVDVDARTKALLKTL